MNLKNLPFICMFFRMMANEMLTGSVLPYHPHSHSHHHHHHHPYSSSISPFSSSQVQQAMNNSNMYKNYGQKNVHPQAIGLY